MPDEVNRGLIEKLKTSPYRNYIKRDLPGDENVVYFMLLDQEKKIEEFFDRLIKEGYDKKFKILKYDSKENMLLFLKEKYSIERIVTFGTVPNKYDNLVNHKAYYAYTKKY